MQAFATFLVSKYWLLQEHCSIYLRNYSIIMRVVLILALYVKLCVFSISRQLLGHDYDKIKTTARDTGKWTAPEALMYHMYSSASDVWSFGTVMYEIWSLASKPYSSYTNSEVRSNIL